MVYIDEKTFPHIVAHYNEHDPSCLSRKHMWMGRKGGVSDWNEIFSCFVCDVQFWIEGIHYSKDDTEYDNPMCDCCEKKFDAYKLSTQNVV